MVIQNGGRLTVGLAVYDLYEAGLAKAGPLVDRTCCSSNSDQGGWASLSWMVVVGQRERS